MHSRIVLLCASVSIMIGFLSVLQMGYNSFQAYNFSQFFPLLKAPHALSVTVFCKFGIRSSVPAYDVIYLSIGGDLCQHCPSVFGPQLASYTMN